MKNKTTISILATILILTGIYFYFTNKEFNHYVKKNILSENKDTEDKKEYEVYCIADGTYSVNTDYAIPQIDINFIEMMIDSIHFNGSGKLWLTYIDKTSKNNRTYYFAIPALIHTEQYPKERSGESSFDYQDRVNKWKENTSRNKVDSTEKERTFYEKKKEFMSKCDSLLKQTVYVKNNDNRFSDVIGTLNSAFRSLIGHNTSNTQKFVVAFSDLQQDMPGSKELPELDPIPERVTLIATNPAPGSSNRCTDEVEEVDSPERVFESIFKN